MYRNPQIHAASEHNPEQKLAILLIVIRRVISICDTDGTDEPDLQGKLILQPERHTWLASQN